MTVDLGKVWKQVSSDMKHLPRSSAVIKNEKIILDSLNKCGISNVGSVLDWGPGGGWLSRAIGAKNVNFVDVVPGYEKYILDTQEDYIEKMKFHTLSGIEMPEITDKIDTVILYSVLYHMPSLEYVEKVIKYILSLTPKTILIRNFFTDEESWTRPNEYNQQTFIRGNIYNKQEFLKLFSEYDLLYDKVVQNYGTDKNKNHNVTENISSFSSAMCLVKAKNIGKLK